MRPPSITSRLGGARDLVVDDFLGLLALLARRRRPGCRWLPGSSLPTVTWPWLSAVAAVSSRVWVERTTRPSGSNLSEVWVMRLKSKSAVTWTRARPGPTTDDDDGLDLLAQTALVGGLAVVGRDAAGDVLVVGAVGEQPAGLVDDRDALRLEAVDRRGDEMADRPHLLGLERAAHLEHDRGRRLDLVAREQRALRQHQVDARGLHPVERPDGAGELALERAQVVDVLDEAGGAERLGLVEDLVADAAALGQAALGEASCAAASPGPSAP